MNRRGFTLMEVLVAVAILGMAMTALFGLFARSIDNLRRVEDLRRYHLAAEAVMNGVLVLDRLPGEGEARGRFDAIEADWTVRVSPWIPESLDLGPAEGVARIEVEVGWDGRSSRRSVRLETIRPASFSYDMPAFARALETVLSGRRR